MMIEPPIDELASKAGGNKFKLCCVVAARAKELEEKIPDELEISEKKSISLAAQELLDGVIYPSDQEMPKLVVKDEFTAEQLPDVDFLDNEDALNSILESDGDVIDNKVIGDSAKLRDNQAIDLNSEDFSSQAEEEAFELETVGVEDEPETLADEE